MRGGGGENKRAGGVVGRRRGWRCVKQECCLCPCGLAGEMVKEMSLKLLLVRLLEASLKPRLFLPAGG